MRSAVCLVFFLAASASEGGEIDPTERLALTAPICRWDFDAGSDGWTAQNDCTVSAEGGVLRVRSTGGDPYLHRGVDLPGGDCMVRLRARGATAGGAQLFWTTAESPRRSEEQSVHFNVEHDGQWHDYAVRFHAPGRLTDLRLDPGAAAGSFEIDSMELLAVEPHPLTIETIDLAGDRVRATVKNHRTAPVAFSSSGREYAIDGHATLVVETAADPTRPVEPVTIELTPKDPTLPPVRRIVFLHHPEAKAEWISRPLGGATLRIAPDGTAARIERDGRPVAFLGPTVHSEGKLPALKRVEGEPLRFQGDGVTLSFDTSGEELSVAIRSQRPCEGPVVRVPGAIEQGLFAGLEYLGKGERSSSKLDITTEEHLRFTPDPMKVTMPLMAVRTEGGSVAVTWSDMALQPAFAVPNVFDAAADSRMALRGTAIDATIRVGRHSLEEDIRWAASRKGLPPLPEPPRTVPQQWDLCLKALRGPLRNEQGWGHCVEDHWPRRPYAAMASTLWRLTGEIPQLPELALGGSHVENPAIFFVTGRAQQWLDHERRQTAQLFRQQQPDGSYRYDGKYREGHFENTAVGVCARPAAMLLEFAWITGDREALEAGVRTLEYMKRFRTPRGAQIWEIPLHTPDLLASAYATWAYVRGYELTGKAEYLELAGRWATTGIPFVYLWSCRPVMLYATTPVWGATNWTAPNWMGLPVQWVGGVYAYALAKLAPYDKSFDWAHLARGILVSAEQQQYPDGEYAGLLPDAFEIKGQTRRPWRINPCALVSLRLALDGDVDALSVAADGQHRVAAPFPVAIRNGTAEIRGKTGCKYQALVDGHVVNVDSQGVDRVPLQ